MASAPATRSPLFVILFTVFVDLIGFGVVIPLLPFYASAVGGGPLVLGLLIAAFFGMQFLLAPVLGSLSDRLGRRPVLLATLVVATAGHLLLAAANSLVLLFAARVLAGMAAGNLSVAQAYIADRTRPEQRAKGMGLIGAAFGVGFAVGPVIGGTLVGYGLFAPALAAAALAATNLGLAVAFLPESLTPERRVAMGSRQAAGLGEAIRRPSIRALVATFFVVSFAFSTVPVAFPSLGIDYFGLKPEQLALVFILIGVISIVMGGAAGRLARRFGEERLVAVGTLAMLAGLAAAPLVANLAAYVGLVAVFSTGVAIALPLIPSLVSKRTPPHEQGSILGGAQAIGSLARVPGPFVAGLLYEQVGPAAPFLVSAGLMGIGFAMTILVYRESREVAARSVAATRPE
ncbi:MAG TPA: MFS transporter [Thermoplasmata archaeon]|nr:MFS transporter [Thermoplasmata archaeon]